MYDGPNQGKTFGLSNEGAKMIELEVRGEQDKPENGSRDGWWIGRPLLSAGGLIWYHISVSKHLSLTLISISKH